LRPWSYTDQVDAFSQAVSALSPRRDDVAGGARYRGSEIKVASQTDWQAKATASMAALRQHLG